jgi:membrane protein required for colicin V production
MNGIDVAISILLIIGLVRGLVKGFVNELASLLSVILGIIGAYHFAEALKVYLEEWFDWDTEYLQLFAFIIVFVSIIIAVTLVGKAVTKLVSYIALGLVNRLLGGVFGTLKVALVLLVVGVIFMTLNQSEVLVKKDKLDQSIAYVLIEEKIIKYLPSLVEFAKENNYIPEETEIDIVN